MLLLAIGFLVWASVVTLTVALCAMAGRADRAAERAAAAPAVRCAGQHRRRRSPSRRLRPIA